MHACTYALIHTQSHILSPIDTYAHTHLLLTHSCISSSWVHSQFYTVHTYIHTKCVRDKKSPTCVHNRFFNELYYFLTEIHQM